MCNILYTSTEISITTELIKKTHTFCVQYVHSSERSCYNHVWHCNCNNIIIFIFIFFYLHNFFFQSSQKFYMNTTFSTTPIPRKLPAVSGNTHTISSNLMGIKRGTELMGASGWTETLLSKIESWLTTNDMRMGENKSELYKIWRDTWGAREDRAVAGGHITKMVRSEVEAGWPNEIFMWPVCLVKEANMKNGMDLVFLVLVQSSDDGFVGQYICLCLFLDLLDAMNDGPEGVCGVNSQT